MRHPRLLRTALVMLLASVPFHLTRAQEPTEPPEQPSEPPGQAAEAEAPAPAAEEQKGFQNRLWVYVGYGSGSADDINSSIRTSARNNALTSLSLDELDYGRVEVGWKLREKKGDFRLRFNGFSENKYKFQSLGRSATLTDVTETVSEGLDWWTVNIEDGLLNSVRNVPRWTRAMDDANGDGTVTRNEVRYLAPDDPNNNGYIATIDQPVADNLQNRALHWEALYGRVWGGRRYSGRWWCGLRYFAYEGNVLAAAWINDAEPGEGFTDGNLFRLLNFYQKTTGLGPTGSMEADFNFFDRKLQFYLSGELAFMLTSLDIDSGPFFTLVSTQFTVRPAPARLEESRDKSSWHTTGEIGVRYHFGFGLTLEAAVQKHGYLDAILLPSQIQIPASETQITRGTTALYSTHDLVFDAWRLGAGFQF